MDIRKRTYTYYQPDNVVTLIDLRYSTYDCVTNLKIIDIVIQI